MVSLTPRGMRVVLLVLGTAMGAAHASEGTSITLREAIDAALTSNPDLATSMFGLRAQDARTRQAALRPALEATFEAENLSGSGETSGTDAAEFTLALSSVVELGGKRDARVGAAQAQYSLLETERQAQQLDVLAEVTRRFVAVAAAQQRVELAQRANELAAQTVAGSERRVNAAKTPHVELDRAKVAWERSQLGERHARVGLYAALKSLAAMWGERQTVIAGKPFDSVSGDFFALPETLDFAQLLTRLEGNPDLLRLASEARLRDAELRMAESMRRPDISLGAGVRRLEESDDYALVASISMPLFSGKRATSQVAEARANRDRVDVEQLSARTKGATVLYSLVLQFEQAVYEARSLKDDMLPRMDEALRETGYAYDRGRYSYLELVDAQREYLSIQEALIEAASDAHDLQIEIERLTNAPLATSSAP